MKTPTDDIESMLESGAELSGILCIALFPPHDGSQTIPWIKRHGDHTGRWNWLDLWDRIPEILNERRRLGLVGFGGKKWSKRGIKDELARALFPAMTGSERVECLLRMVHDDHHVEEPEHPQSSLPLLTRLFSRWSALDVRAGSDPIPLVRDLRDYGAQRLLWDAPIVREALERWGALSLSQIQDIMDQSQIHSHPAGNFPLLRSHRFAPKHGKRIRLR